VTTAVTDRRDIESRSGLLRTFGRDGLLQILLVANSIFMLYPIIVMVFSAFKTTTQIYNSPFAVPNFGDFTNFAAIWTGTNFIRYFGNSILVTAASLVLILVLGAMAAYAIARYEFKGSAVVLLFFLAGLTVPLKLAIIPLFILMRDLGILNNQLSLVAVYVAMGLPTTVFILTSFLRTLPSELEDAARMDGASEFLIMRKIMMPLATPALVIAGIQNAVPIWNDFFFPLIFIQNDDLKTLPQGLTTFMGEYSTNWGVLFAGLTLSAAPIVIIYIVLSRQFISGMTQGAIK
jgi:raffinose/stachyose/melibiose transport system permease protein